MVLVHRSVQFKAFRRALGLGLLTVLSAIVSKAEADPQLRFTMVESTGGVHLLMVEAGDPNAPGILFIHGFAQSYLSFRRQFASELADKHHLVAFDLRGEGGSDKPDDPQAYGSSKIWADDVAAIIKASKLQRPVVVGWSYGGYVVMDYIRHYGTANIAGVDLVGSLGGLAGPPPHDRSKSEAARAMQAKSDRQRSMDLLNNIEAGDETASAYIVPTMTTEERRTLFATEMMMPAYVRRDMLARDLDNQDVAKLIRAPVLLTRGSQDPTMPEAALADVVKSVPQAIVSTYANSGHLTFIEHAERFDQELLDFADRVEGRAPP